MQLKVKKINIKTGRKYIAVLNEITALKLDLHAGDRVKIKNDHEIITAILEVSKNGFPKNTLGLFFETHNKLQCQRGQKVMIEPATKPISTMYIKKKLDGKRLTDMEIDEIIKDVVEDNFSDTEMSYFVAGCYTNGLSDKETAALTKSIVNHGARLTFKNTIVADKHCIGGVPGNRTTMIIIPIVSSTGIIMPKTSSRAITSPSGTADTMEVLANVTNDTAKIKRIIKKIHGCITWGGGVDLAAADDYMIRVRHPLSLDPEGMLLASIMAKKHSVSANHVLIDIPIGPQVKIKSRKHAEHLKKRFLTISRMLGMKAKVIFSNGNEPIGNGIGPLLEARDVMKVLRNDTDAPEDLRNKALEMAGILFELTKKTPEGKGKALAEKILTSGQAEAQMEKIIGEQGKKPPMKPAKFRFTYPAPSSGKIIAIDNKTISRIARMAGAPKAPQAGLYLHKKLGFATQKKEALFTIYASSPDRLKYAVSYTLNNPPYSIE